MRARVAGVVLLVLALASGVEEAATEPVLRQLDAFRRNDYDAAYTFASADIHRLFGRAEFEAMVKRGYPEIADSVRAHVAGTRVSADDHVYVVVKVRGANGQQIEALYEVIREGGAWKINAVVSKPDPGEDA